MDFKKVLFKTNTIDVEKALPDAVVFCNNDGKIQWVSDKATEVFETSKMHLLTSNIADFIENVQNLIKIAIENNRQVITKIAGQEVYLNMTAKANEDGYVLSFRNIEDITAANKVTNVTQNNSNNDKNLFLLKLANDFKSPLQSIVGFSQAMTDGLGGSISIQQEKYIKIIKKNSSDLMYFINKLMELTDTESNTKSPDLKMFDVISVINNIARFNEQLCNNRDIRWSVNVEEGVKNTIISDETIVKTALQNILEVILKSVDMGDIVISVSTPDDEFIKNKNLFGSKFLMISIYSSSLLLSEADLDCLFEPYKIVDTPNRKNLLRAITLACVKNLIQNLNGTVWVESKILKNTCFNILIPQGKN